MSFVQMDSLNRIIQKWDESQLVDFPDKPTEPREYKPRVEEPWNSLGNALNMDGAEVQVIIQAALYHPTPAVITAWEKFLFIAKLNAGDELIAHQAKLASWRKDFESQMRNYKITLEQYQQTHKKRLSAQGQLLDQLRNRWNKLIKSLLVAIERFPTVKDLAQDDVIAIGVLRNYGLAHIDNEGRVLLEVSALSVLDTETIVEICQLVKSFIEPLRLQEQSQ